MSSAVLSPPQAADFRQDFEDAASTEPRFEFDTFCKMQLLLVREPVSSGAVMWFGRNPEESIELDFVKPFTYLPDFSSYAASGALVVDANLLFANACDRPWNTPLRPTLHTFWLDIIRHQFRKNLQPSNEAVIFTSAPEVTIALPMRAFVSGAPFTTAEIVESPTVDITTPYSKLVAELIETGPWGSQTRLAKLLGTSKTQVGRILKGEAEPNDDLAPRIDELHRFHQQIRRLSRGDSVATRRLLTTARERDGFSALDFLEKYDYRNAFRAIMEAASPKPRLAQVQQVPRRWYNEPSRDLYDDDIEPDD